MIKFMNFPEEYNYVKSVEVNGVIYVNNCYSKDETTELIIPFLKIQLILPIFPG